MNSNNNSFALIIFGATGNLAQLKLIPALYDLEEAKLLPGNMSIICIGRKMFTNNEFRNYSLDVLTKPNYHHQHPIKPNISRMLLKRISYISGDILDSGLYDNLEKQLDTKKICTNRIYYMATYPDFYETIFNNLESSGLNKQECGWVRVMIEKPIGQDLKSARKLNSLLLKYYIEDQIYRLDHYLGKETLQNILTFRFGNTIFEPFINKYYIDHFQITAAEEFGIGDRGGYYDKVGALKDVGQNHILQMIALTTMEAPLSFTNPDVTRQRINLISKLVSDPKKIVFGQYSGYQKERDVNPDSKTDTFFASRTYINNERFKDIPIYIRAGKRLNRTVTEVAIVFKNNSKRLFGKLPMGAEPNMLIYRIQPNDGIVLRFLSKIPGPEIKLTNEYLQYCYRITGGLPDPYLRLLDDALRGDQTFFIDAPEVEAQWKFIDPLIGSKDKVEFYKSGTWGPDSAEKLIESDGRKWIEPSVAFCAL